MKSHFLLPLLFFSANLFSQDTLDVKGKLLYLDSIACETNHWFPYQVKLLLVEIKDKPLFCRNEIVLCWYTDCESELEIGKEYSFKIVKNVVLNDPLKNSPRIDLCDDYVLKARVDMYLDIIEINGIKALHFGLPNR